MLGLGNTLHGGIASATPADLITMTTALDFWFKKSVGVAIDQWDDSSGNNNHAVQEESINQAALNATGGLHFTSSGDVDHYDITKVTVAQNTGFAFATVVNCDSASTSTLISDSSNERVQFKDGDEILITCRTGGGTAVETILKAAGTPFPFSSNGKMLILINRSDGAGGLWTVYKDGALVTQSGSTNEKAGQNIEAIEIDAVGVEGTGARGFDGDIDELAFWNKGLSTQEITDVNNYLTTVHGL
jgi:hypothetical protein